MNSSTPSDDSQPTGPFTEGDIQRMFDAIRSASFADISTDTQLVIRRFGDVGMSTPFMKVHINMDELNKYGWPKDAVVGAIAHEIAHQVQYQRRSRVGRFVWLWDYMFSKSKKRGVENEADEVAIERGYANEILLARVYQLNFNDPKRAEREKKIYLSVEALEKLIAERGA